MITKARFYGGSVHKTFTGTLDIHPIQGRVHVMNGTSSPVARFPDARNFQDWQIGRPLLIIINRGDSILFNDNADGAVGGARGTDTMSLVSLLDNSSQAGEWAIRTTDLL